MPQQPTRRGANAAQLRDAIDRGRTGSKVAFPDPAAAPLGTDEEAAGTPPTSAHVATAMRQELSNPAAQHAQPRGPDRGEHPRAWLWTLAVIAVVLAGLAIVMLG